MVRNVFSIKPVFLPLVPYKYTVQKSDTSFCVVGFVLH